MKRLVRVYAVRSGKVWAVLLSLIILLGACTLAEQSADHDHHTQEHTREAKHSGHTPHTSDKIAKLNPDEMREFGVHVEEAGSGNLRTTKNLNGEIVIDPDRLAHVVPRVGGVVRHVYRTLGDRVRSGEILAGLDSRELAELKSGWLVARERVQLAEATIRREEKLWTEQISSEREFLEAQREYAEAMIEMHTAEQKLQALGFSDAELENLSFAEHELFTRYDILAPFDGRIIEKHITIGEMIKSDAEAFVVADLSSVWIILAVYQKDLPHIDLGQLVRVSLGDSTSIAEGSVSYISPVLDRTTRTAQARIVLPNPEGVLRPGSFVSGEWVLQEVEVPLLLPTSALQTIDGETVVFVKTQNGFEPHPVGVGRGTETHVEIKDGLFPGQHYVAAGAFTLKAELAKGSFGDSHGH